MGKNDNNNSNSYRKDFFDAADKSWHIQKLIDELSEIKYKELSGSEIDLLCLLLTDKNHDSIAEKLQCLKTTVISTVSGSIAVYIKKLLGKDKEENFRFEGLRHIVDLLEEAGYRREAVEISIQVDNDKLSLTYTQSQDYSDLKNFFSDLPSVAEKIQNIVQEMQKIDKSFNLVRIKTWKHEK